MERNPYTPPAAAVADPENAPPSERPKSVTNAIRLVWLTFVIGIPFGFYSTATSDAGAGAVVVALVVVAIVDAVAFGICFWLLDGVGKGKNWARIVLLVLFLLGVAGSLLTPVMIKALGQSVPESTVLEWSVMLVQDGLMIAALFLMFSPSARPWFARRP